MSPNSFFIGERERFLGVGVVGEVGERSSLISSKIFAGDGVRVTLRPREYTDETAVLSVSSLDLC
jgi:hypothetical protein